MERGVKMEKWEERVEYRLNDHAKRIMALEINEGKQSERITSLCEKLDNLAETIANWMVFAQNLFWKVLGTAGGLIILLGGFMCWYIQSLPR